MKKESVYTVELDEPYPKATIRRKNMMLASALSQAYGGKTGELTSISEYLYQSILCAEEYPAISELFEDLAKVEMRHFRILGEMICALGAPPKVCVHKDFCRRIPWSGGYPFYRTTLGEALAGSMRDEEHAAAFYRKLAGCVENESVSQLLLRLAKDEEHHETLLGQALEDLKRMGGQ